MWWFLMMLMTPFPPFLLFQQPTGISFYDPYLVRFPFFSILVPPSNKNGPWLHIRHVIEGFFQVYWGLCYFACWFTGSVTVALTVNGSLPAVAAVQPVHYRLCTHPNLHKITIMKCHLCLEWNWISLGMVLTGNSFFCLFVFQWQSL